MKCPPTHNLPLVFLGAVKNTSNIFDRTKITCVGCTYAEQPLKNVINTWKLPVTYAKNRSPFALIDFIDQFNADAPRGGDRFHNIWFTQFPILFNQAPITWQNVGGRNEPEFSMAEFCNKTRNCPPQAILPAEDETARKMVHFLPRAHFLIVLALKCSINF